ncbi:MAG: hypothetical protein AAF639_37225, partial [Chloroflexota bacterium]
NLTSPFSHSYEAKNQRRTREDSSLCRGDSIVQLFVFNLFLTITKFLRLVGKVAEIDYDEYQIAQVAKLLGIFHHILTVEQNS